MSSISFALTEGKPSSKVKEKRWFLLLIGILTFSHSIKCTLQTLELVIEFCVLVKQTWIVKNIIITIIIIIIIIVIKTVMIMIIMTVITIIINCTENRTIFFFEVLEELVVIEENKKIYPKSVYKLAEWVFLIHFSVTGRIVWTLLAWSITQVCFSQIKIICLDRWHGGESLFS